MARTSVLFIILPVWSCAQVWMFTSTLEFWELIKSWKQRCCFCIYGVPVFLPTWPASLFTYFQVFCLFFNFYFLFQLVFVCFFCLVCGFFFWVWFLLLLLVFWVFCVWFGFVFFFYILHFDISKTTLGHGKWKLPPECQVLNQTYWSSPFQNLKNILKEQALKFNIQMFKSSVWISDT